MCHFKNILLCSDPDERDIDGKHMLTLRVGPDEQCMFRNLNPQREVQQQFSILCDPERLKPLKCIKTYS